MCGTIGQVLARTEARRPEVARMLQVLVAVITGDSRDMGRASALAAARVPEWRSH